MGLPFGERVVSAFVLSISLIVQICSKEKVRRIYARRIIAFVTHEHSHRNTATKQSIRNAMRSVGFSNVPKNPIPLGASM